ncbi:MAG: hypothetical protein MJ210_00995 [Alphaproteobacteria bacterium]|nr:hypothetical protein [Alphaproteobacteria bacterium]
MMTSRMDIIMANKTIESCFVIAALIAAISWLVVVFSGELRETGFIISGLSGFIAAACVVIMMARKLLGTTWQFD